MIYYLISIALAILLANVIIFIIGTVKINRFLAPAYAVINLYNYKKAFDEMKKQLETAGIKEEITGTISYGKYNVELEGNYLNAYDEMLKLIDESLDNYEIIRDEYYSESLEKVQKELLKIGYEIRLAKLKVQG